MKPGQALIRTLGVFLFLGVVALHAEKAPVTARMFAAGNGKLDSVAAARYIMFRDEIPLSEVVPPGKWPVTDGDIVGGMADGLDDLRSATGHEAPWTWQELDAAFPPKKTKKEKAEAAPGWQKVPVLTRAYPLGEDGENGAIGPMRLRQSTEDLPKPTSESRGATFGFSDNFLIGGSGAWNTQGVVQLPVVFIKQFDPAPGSAGDPGAGGEIAGRSLEIQAGPALEWGLVQTQGSDKDSINELNISLPVAAYYSPGTRKATGSYKENISSSEALSRLFLFQARPYFQTDFDGDYGIFGGQLTMEYVGSIFGSRVLTLGGYQSFAGQWQYQLRFIPVLDLNVVTEDGANIDRDKGETWFQLGSIASLEFRCAISEGSYLNFGASYQFGGSFSDTVAYSYLLKLYATYWFTKYAGLTYEYSRGELSLTNQDINLLTLGLELKY